MIEAPQVLGVLRRRPGHIFNAQQICDQLRLPSSPANVHRVKMLCFDMARGGTVLIHWHSVGFRARTVRFSVPELSVPERIGHLVSGVYNALRRGLARLRN